MLQRPAGAAGPCRRPSDACACAAAAPAAAAAFAGTVRRLKGAPSSARGGLLVAAAARPEGPEPDRAPSAPRRPRECPLPPPPGLGGADPRSRWNAASLAFLGDAVWEVHVRTALYTAAGPWRGSTAAAVTRRVSTQALATAYDDLAASAPPWVTPEEAAVLRWAANSATVSGKGAGGGRGDYKKATAFEALVAHLYLSAPQRLEALAAHLLAPERAALWDAPRGATAGGGVDGGGSDLGSGSRSREEEGSQDEGGGSGDGGGGGASGGPLEAAGGGGEAGGKPAAAGEGGEGRGQQQQQPARPTAVGFGTRRRPQGPKG